MLVWYDTSTNSIGLAIPGADTSANAIPDNSRHSLKYLRSVDSATTAATAATAAAAAVAATTTTTAAAAATEPGAATARIVTVTITSSPGDSDTNGPNGYSFSAYAARSSLRASPSYTRYSISDSIAEDTCRAAVAPQATAAATAAATATVCARSRRSRGEAIGLADHYYCGEFRRQRRRSRSRVTSWASPRSTSSGTSATKRRPFPASSWKFLEQAWRHMLALM